MRGAHPGRTRITDNKESTIILRRRLTMARWTVVIGRDAKVASMRTNVNPVTDSEEVCRIVASMVRCTARGQQ